MDSTAQESSFFGGLFRYGTYKPSQGFMVRRATMAAFGAVCLLAAWRLYAYLVNYNLANSVRYSSALVLFAVGMWIVYRLVNWPKFADFLVSVETEMNKVSWPGWPELIRCSIVVIVCLLALSAAIYGIDLVWTVFFQRIGILRFKG